MSTELAPKNAVGDQVAAMVAGLRPGLYRSQMTVCRIHLGDDGLEKRSEVVLSHCADFEVKPPALPARGEL